jgi:sugar phosphate isomerase/epimerase
MPEDTQCEAYSRLADTVRVVADYCASREMSFAMETGQETAEAMLAFVHTVDRGNVGVNFDPANMVLYGTGGPVEAVGTLAQHVMHVHVKDGLYPVREGQLGAEVPLGEGKVGIERYIAKLKAIGYDGPLIIEREAGHDRLGDIRRGKALIESLL